MITRIRIKVIKDAQNVEYMSLMKAIASDYVYFDDTKLVPMNESIIVQVNTGFVDDNKEDVYTGDMIRYVRPNVGMAQLRAIESIVDAIDIFTDHTILSRIIVG